MAHHGHQSSAKLERDVRVQRAEISETLTEINGRLTPGQLLDEALHSSGIRQSVSCVGSAMARNPLPVVLIGDGVLWWPRRPVNRSAPHTTAACGGAWARQCQAKGKQ